MSVTCAGVIVLYRLYHNGLVMYNSSTACNMSLTGLETWSAHELRLETCTAVGCTSSPSVVARTQELAPEGHIGLRANVSSSRTVLVYWTPVTANGNLSYNVYFTGPFYTHQRKLIRFALYRLYLSSRGLDYHFS